jgi:hypothetical protein
MTALILAFTRGQVVASREVSQSFVHTPVYDDETFLQQNTFSSAFHSHVSRMPTPIP